MLTTALAMDPWTVATFMGAALLLYLTPGPDMMFTLASGAAGGPRAGLAAATGICFGVLTHVLLAAAGLAALVAASPATLDVIRYVGAAYLAWLAVQTWRHASAPDTRKGRASTRAAFTRGYVTNILNPKVGLFVLAFLPQFADPAIGPVWHQIILLGLLLFAGGLITDGAYGIFAGLMAAQVRARGALMQRMAALVFGGLAARLVLD